MRRAMMAVLVALLILPTISSVRSAEDEWDEKIAKFTDVIRLDPKNWLGYSERGIAWLSKREYDKAIADFTETIRLDPKNASAYGNRGSAWSSKREYDK